MVKVKVKKQVITVEEEEEFLGCEEIEWECAECGWTGPASEVKTVVGDRADCSYGEMDVCPECESDDISEIEK